MRESEINDVVIPIRVTPTDAARLDEIAKEGRMTRGACARSILLAVIEDDQKAHAGK